MDIVEQVYRLVETFPRKETYGLASQMERAAVSIPANIAEGFKGGGQTDKIHFYNAQGSLEELRYYFILRRDLRHRIEYEPMASEAEAVSRMLHGLIRSIERRQQTAP